MSGAAGAQVPDVRAKLAHVLWIGGATDSGKTSVARNGSVSAATEAEPVPALLAALYEDLGLAQGGSIQGGWAAGGQQEGGKVTRPEGKS